MLADFKNSRDDDEKHGFSPPLREQHLSWFERSRLQVGGQFGQLLRLQGFEKDHVLKKWQHWKWRARTFIGCSRILGSARKVETGIVKLPRCMPEQLIFGG